MEVAGLNDGVVSLRVTLVEVDADGELNDDDLNFDESELKNDFPRPELDLDTFASCDCVCWVSGTSPGAPPAANAIKLMLLLLLGGAELPWAGEPGSGFGI